jgi:hypothetical protein
MKNILISFLLAGIVSIYARAQEITTSNTLVNKNGVRILPQAGDYALGIGANAFLDYLGNIMNNSENNTTRFTYPNMENTIYGKYFVTDQMAYRAKARIGFSIMTHANNVQNDENPYEKVEDKMVTDIANIILSLGFEKRRGSHRIQGFYGMEGAIGFKKLSVTYTYGNAFSPTNQTPTTTIDFDYKYSTNPSSRKLENSSNLSFGIGARGFVGVEYFIAPKISLAGEFGWGLQITLAGKNVNKTETWNWNQNSVTENTVSSPGDKIIEMDTDNNLGQIALIMHF